MPVPQARCSDHGVTAAARPRRFGGRGPVAAVVGAALTVIGSLSLVAAAVESGVASADTAPYELYCPGTPIGDISLNDVVTTGTLTPAPGSTGSTFVITNYQTSVPLPASLATAAAALQSSITGTANTAVDVVGATPASVQEGPFSFDVPIPTPVPAGGLTLAVPATPTSVGPFTATGDTITVSEDSSATITLEVAGTALALTCTAYPNDAVASGIASAPPTQAPISPVIATQGTTGGTTTTTTASTTTTTTTAGSGGQPPTGPYELYCPGTPVGNIALNDVSTSALFSPSVPAIGHSFTVSDYQTTISIPAVIATAAQALGNSDISGTAQTTVEAFGASPAAITTPAMSFDVTIPNPVPAAGLSVAVPSTGASIGPFTATASTVTIEDAPTVKLTLVVSGNALNLQCTAYADNSVPTGITSVSPTGPPVSPVVATVAATGTQGGPTGVSAPYELYCPHTPVGDLDFNDVTSSGTISTSLASGDQFELNGYQISIPVPAGVAGAAQGLSNTAFAGLAASAVDAYGASPSQVPTGSLAFAVPIPDPVPSTGVTLDLPSQPTTVGPFTADGGPVALAQDQSVLVVAKLSGKAFTMSCTAFPNDSISSSGSTTTAPSAQPIRPLIVEGTASGTPTNPPPAHPPNPGPGSPYELYCKGSPIGDLAVNDVVTTATITPSTPNAGDTFELSGLQTTFTLPQAVAQQMEDLGLTSLQGDLLTFLDVSGTEGGYGYPYPVYGSTGLTGVTTVVSTGSSSGGSTVNPPSFPVFPGIGDMPFSITLPSPVPVGGVPVTASTQGGFGGGTFVAAGGPITVSLFGTDMYVSAFGDQFGMFCQTLANDSVPTGISTVEPVQDGVQPVIATATATDIPPPPGPPGAYELYCPGTPIGTVVLNGVTSNGTISPADPASGTQFEVTGYQAQVTLPAAIVSAAAALGNTDIAGYASTALDATGATPATLPSTQMAFDVPIPSTIPAGGVTFPVPSTAATIGPFTATGGPITIDQSGKIAMALTISGAALDLTCTTYPDNSLPSGITQGVPPTNPISVQIATTGSATGPVPTTTPGPGTTQDPSPTTATTAATGGGGGGTGSTGAGGGSATGGGGGSGTGSNGVVTASSGALAFTGSGPGVRFTALMGAAALLLGLALLVAVEDPRKLVRHLVRRTGAAGRS